MHCSNKFLLSREDVSYDLVLVTALVVIALVTPPQVYAQDGLVRAHNTSSAVAESTNAPDMVDELRSAASQAAGRKSGISNDWNEIVPHYDQAETDLRGAPLPFALLPATEVLSGASSPNFHDQNVANEIRNQLNAAFRLPGQIAIATRIQLALAKETAKRDEKGGSNNEELRDAEYYLHGLYGASAKDWNHISLTLGVPIYNALKWAALRCSDAGFPELAKRMRTEPDNPVSPPGGSSWAYRGLSDGTRLDGKDVVGSRASGHGLSLTALSTVAPCETQ